MPKMISNGERDSVFVYDMKFRLLGALLLGLHFVFISPSFPIV